MTNGKVKLKKDITFFPSLRTIMSTKYMCVHGEKTFT